MRRSLGNREAPVSAPASHRARRRPGAAPCPARPCGNMPPALPRLVSPQLRTRSLAGTGAGGNRAMAGAAALAAVQGVAARSGRGRQLPAGASLLP
jgi:hypothetical protein